MCSKYEAAVQKNKPRCAVKLLDLNSSSSVS